jgi:hypothetical protein
MENPASRRAPPSGYKSPTIAEMFGFNKPVPRTIKISPKKNGALASRNEEVPIEMWPSEMNTAPNMMARRKPNKRSATHPPGRDARYTLAA